MKPEIKIPPLTARDRHELRSRGVSVGDVTRQARLLLKTPSLLDVLRPCSLGDGIEKLSLSERHRLSHLVDPALREGRVSKFVPSSGAASRLFTDLLQLDLFCKVTENKITSLLGSSPHPFARSSSLFFSNLRGLALSVPLGECLSARHHDLRTLLARKDFAPILEALFNPSDLDLARRPKALIPFHRKGRQVLTAVEEHLAESVVFGVRKAHFTVPEEFLPKFKGLAKEWTRLYFRRQGVRFHLTFSVQDPATDTLALEEGKGWVHRADGSLLFRPGGHGALLGNLEETGGDIVLIKNIDNVPVHSFQAEGNRWRKALAGRLIEAQTEAAAWIKAIDKKNPSEGAVRGAEEFIQKNLGMGGPPLSLSERSAQAIGRLDRPWRVCGMVPNVGEPGGGPFWVSGKEGPSRQILEGSQLAKSQKKFIDQSTHFNPVDMVVGLKDRNGRSYDLSRFADPAQAIVSVKPFESREIRTLEHPGLWNGAMAHWNTIFVEVPAAIFHPVKTITDLLRPGHRDPI